jgi:hypothetical protein
VQGLGKRLDAQLASVGVDETNLSGPDAIVDPELVGSRSGYEAPPLGLSVRVLDAKKADGGKARAPLAAIRPDAPVVAGWGSATFSNPAFPELLTS